MKRLLPFLLFFAICVNAADVYFDSPWTLWQNATVLIWVPDGHAPLEPKEFCLSLRRFNSGIGDPKCRIFGEWERDSIAARYGTWLSNNMEKEIGSGYLRARHPAMMAKMQAVEDNIVLYMHSTEDNKVQIAIFDETSVEPRAAGTVKMQSDKIALGDDIASSFFSKRTKRRLTKEERLKKQTEPDEFYQEVPNFRAWGGLAFGYSQAQFPFTPDDWYKSHIKSHIRNYRVTKDSASLWNFLDDSEPFFSAYVGGTWYGFIGAELIYRYANRRMKIDKRDTIYEELDHWDFSQHEIGINLMFSKAYPMTKWFTIIPFAFLGFQYSFFVEDIALKDDVKNPSKAYKVRIKFENAYKGALLGFGGNFIFWKHYGLGLRAGLSSRGRNLYESPSEEAGAAPTTIGASTIDCFVSVGLEYHWNP